MRLVCAISWSTTKSVRRLSGQMARAMDLACSMLPSSMNQPSVKPLVILLTSGLAALLQTVCFNYDDYTRIFVDDSSFRPTDHRHRKVRRFQDQCSTSANRSIALIHGSELIRSTLRRQRRPKLRTALYVFS